MHSKPPQLNLTYLRAQLLHLVYALEEVCRLLDTQPDPVDLRNCYHTSALALQYAYEHLEALGQALYPPKPGRERSANVTANLPINIFDICQGMLLSLPLLSSRGRHRKYPWLPLLQDALRRCPEPDPIPEIDIYWMMVYGVNHPPIDADNIDIKPIQDAICRWLKLDDSILAVRDYLLALPPQNLAPGSYVLVTPRRKKPYGDKQLTKMIRGTYK